MSRTYLAKPLRVRKHVASILGFIVWCVVMNNSALANGSLRGSQSQTDKIFGLSHMLNSLVDEPKLFAKTPAQWSHPLIDSDGSIVYVALSHQTLAAVRLENGEILWKLDKLGTLGRAMFQWRGELFVGVNQSLVVFDRFTGKEKAKISLGATVSGAPELVAGRLIVPIRPNAYAAIEIESKKIAWQVSRPQPKGITIFGQASPTYDPKNQQLILGFSDGVVMAVKADSGDINWKRELASSQQPFRDIDSKPLLSADQRTVMVACYATGVFGLDLETGKKAWHNPAFKKINTWIGLRDNQRIIAVDGNGRTFGFSPQNSKEAWIYKSRAGVGTAITPIGERWIGVSVSRGASALLDQETGRPLQVFHPGSGVRAPMAYFAPNLSMLTNRGTVLLYTLGQ